MRARECGCPPWVEPCVHYDGAILVLVDEDALEPHCYSHDGWSKSVHLVSGFGKCAGCGCTVVQCSASDVCGDVCEGFTDLTAARDEFDRRAAQLVGREP